MIYKYLPYFIFRHIFGDRKKFGLVQNENDNDWKAWVDFYWTFYADTQKNSLGSIINNFGFKIMKEVDLTKKSVLELGPGIIEHLKYNSTKPESYIIADLYENALDKSEIQLKEKFGISNILKLKVKGIQIPLADSSVDMIITFHQLEHIYELEGYLMELKRILRKDGLIIGAVPCDGGVAWGIGRYLTTRRYVKKNADFNYDKIICWEHPNFVNKIKNALDANFKKVKTVKKPFSFLPFDFNFSWSFIYQKKD